MFVVTMDVVAAIYNNASQANIFKNKSIMHNIVLLQQVFFRYFLNVRKQYVFF